MKSWRVIPNRQISSAEMERMMKVQELILRAMAGTLKWWEAAEIIGVTDRTMRRWRQRYEEGGYDGLYDHRKRHRCRAHIAPTRVGPYWTRAFSHRTHTRSRRLHRCRGERLRAGTDCDGHAHGECSEKANCPACLTRAGCSESDTIPPCPSVRCPIHNSVITKNRAMWLPGPSSAPRRSTSSAVPPSK